MNKMSTDKLTGTEAEAPSIEKAPARSPKRFLRPLLMFIVPLLLLIGGGYYWMTSGGSVSTDDAQVKQDIVSVSPQVNGQIVQTLVRNGARVKRGDLLFRIDPQPSGSRSSSRAQLAAAKLQTSHSGPRRPGLAPTSLANRQSRDQEECAWPPTALLKQVSRRAPIMRMRSRGADGREGPRRCACPRRERQCRIAPGEQPSIAQAQAAVDKAKLDLSRTDIRRRWTASSRTPIISRSGRWP